MTLKLGRGLYLFFAGSSNYLIILVLRLSIGRVKRLAHIVAQVIDTGSFQDIPPNVKYIFSFR